MAKVSNIVKSKQEPKYKVQKRNRCELCGRAKGFMRRFKLCRLCFRELAHKGDLPGVTKASW